MNSRLSTDFERLIGWEGERVIGVCLRTKWVRSLKSLLNGGLSWGVSFQHAQMISWRGKDEGEAMMEVEKYFYCVISNLFLWCNQFLQKQVLRKNWHEGYKRLRFFYQISNNKKISPSCIPPSPGNSSLAPLLTSTRSYRAFWHLEGSFSASLHWMLSLP